MIHLFFKRIFIGLHYEKIPFLLSSENENVFVLIIFIIL